MLRIFLTTPYIDKIVEPLYDKPLFVRNSLASIAGFLKTNPVFEIKCVDAKFENKSKEILIEEIIAYNPDIIGISSYTYEIFEANNLAKTIKKNSVKSIIVIGGSHVSAIPEKTLEEFPDFDIGVIGESELTFLELCLSFENNTEFKSINGIAFRNEHNQVVLTPTRDKIQDLDILPMPAWDLLPKAQDYFVQTSRGCPFNCNFCFNPNGNKVRQKSANKIIEEVEWLIETFHPQRISFGDEAFAANVMFANEILDKIIELKIGDRVKWDIQTHVSFISEDLLMKMKQANVYKIEMGVESGNSDIIREMGKGINKEKVKKAFCLARKYKIRTGAFLIFGHPNETRSSIWDSIRFAASLNPTEPVFAIMVPFPGTKIAEYMANNEYGYVNINPTWDKYRKQINGAIHLKNISNSKLKTYLIIANIWVFLRNFRFWGLIKFSFSNLQNLMNFLKNY